MDCHVNILGDPDHRLTITTADVQFAPVVPNRFRVQLEVDEEDYVPLSVTRPTNVVVERAVRVGATVWL